MIQPEDTGRGGAPIQLFIRMNPPWVFIDEIRRFVESFCACAALGADREAQVALAVHELMQNAVPQARGQEVELDLEVDPKADRVWVRVMNECPEDEFVALRLARVRFEAQLDIRVRRKSATRIIVEAEGPLRAPKLPAAGGTHG